MPRDPGTAVVRPARVVPGAVHRKFTRGHERPRGITWFGVRSFWGHMRHFVASAIATEDVDSRDWMTADDPRALMERVARLLGGAGAGGTVTERLGRDLFIDYVADTGDDVSVSRAVGGLISAAYELPDPRRPDTHVVVPRGDILLFGGDTAYPVATADEIQSRVIVPWNQVFAEREDGRRRVLLGIPGNHDWYDGLDGFGRMFRRHVDYQADGQARPTLHGSTRTLLGHYAEWAREFVRGGQVEKPHTLDLVGYTAVQSASYFILPLAPGLPLLGVDRQLKNIDSRQKYFFTVWLNQHVAVSPWVVMPDPAYKFGAKSATGAETIRTLGLTLSARPHLVMSGDIHHYRRETEGPTLHVTAGGGGAFLHPAALAERGGRPAVAEWPDARQSRRLLRQVPWKVALGRSGFLPHLAFLVALAPLSFSLAPWSHPVLPIVTAVVITICLVLIGGGRRRAGAFAVALVCAMATVAGAIALLYGMEEGALPLGKDPLLSFAVPSAALLVSSLVGGFFFGVFLALLTVLGYENTQAFTALDHPGFKHFVRLRIRADGTAVDGWCIGLADPVKPGEGPVLVDSFTWHSR